MAFKEKLSAARNLIVSRANAYHNGGSAFNGLSDDVEYTLGLDNRAEVFGVTSLVTGFIALAIIIAIGVIILSSVQTAMPAVNETSPYYALQSTLETSTVSGYGLIAIVIIIVAAAAIMMSISLIEK